MTHKLSIEKQFNMRIMESDAELLCKAILCAGDIKFSEQFDNQSWQRLQTMRTQLMALQGWKEQS
jgi:hypothetical protein